MKLAADKIFESKLKQSTSKEEIKKFLDEGNMVRTSFCSIGLEGEPCAKIMEKEIGGEVRGEWFGKNEKVFCNCPICGKEAKHVVYVAKSH